VAAASTALRTGLSFSVLGPLQVSYGEREISIAGSRQRALLAYFVLNANRVVSSERLIDELFGEQPTENALNSVHGGISRLRRQLAAAGVTDSPIVTRPPGYLFELSEHQLDLHEFERLVEQGRRQLDASTPEAAAETFRRALGLWRGSPLADISAYAFVRGEAERLEELRLAAVGDRIESDLALGRHREVVAELESLVAQNPLRERLRGQLMLALYRSGRQAHALQVYQDTRQLLVSELGLEPSEGLQRLEKAILNHDPALELPEATTRATESLPSAPRSPRTRRSLGVGLAVLLFAGAVAAVAVLLSTRTEGDTKGVAPNSVAAIDPETNRVVGSAPVGAGPTQVVSSATGVWVLNQGDQTVSLIDPANRKRLRTFSVGATPSDLAADRHGLWVASPNGQVALVDPERQTVVKRFKVRVWPKVRPNDPSLVGQLASGFGSLWVVSGGRTLTRVDPATARVVATIHGVPTGAGNEGGLAVGRGSVWAADLNQVTRVDPDSNAGEPVPLGVSVWHINGLAAGGGKLWFGDVGNARVWEVGGAPPQVIRSIAVGLNPLGLAYGEGSLWVANAGDGTVMRIDPDRGDVVATIEVGGAPVGIAVDNKTVWVTVD
jgi:YVTN family beta-propeller protein